MIVCDVNVLVYAYRTEAYLAALAIEHGAELITADRDFARFAGVRWRHPFN